MEELADRVFQSRRVTTRTDLPPAPVRNWVDQKMFPHPRTKT